MKMEFLRELELSQEQIDKIMAEYGKDIGKEQKKTEKAESDLAAAVQARDALQTQLTDVQTQLKSFEGIDVEAKDAKIQELTETIESKQKEHQEELERTQRQAESREFFAALQTPFVNDETRDHYIARLEAALDDPQNRGKSRQDILDALTSGEDGKPRPGIYRQPENPNQLVLEPAADKLPDKPPKKEPKLFF